MKNVLVTKKIDCMKFAVDIPTDGEDWVNITYFTTRKAAIKFAMKKFGADKNGNINLVTAL